MVRGNSFNNVCVARRKRRRSFGRNCFSIAPPPSKRVVEETSATDCIESRPDETRLQIKVDLRVTWSEVGSQKGEAVVLRLLTIKGEDDISYNPNDSPGLNARDQDAPSKDRNSLHSIDQILEDVGLTEMPEETCQNHEATGKGCAPEKEFFKPNLATFEDKKEAEQTRVCFAVVTADLQPNSNDPQATEESLAGAVEVSKADGDKQSFSHKSGQQGNKEGRVEEQIILLLSQHAAPQSKSPAKEEKSLQQEKQEGNNEIHGESCDQSTDENLAELKSHRVDQAVLDYAQLQNPSDARQNVDYVKKAYSSPMADGTETCLHKSTGQVIVDCKKSSFLEGQDLGGRFNPEMIKASSNIGHIENLGQEMPGMGKGVGTTGKAHESLVVGNMQEEKRAEIKVPCPIQPTSTKVSAETRGFHEIAHCCRITKPGKRSTRKRSQIEASERPNKDGRMSRWSTEKPTKKRKSKLGMKVAEVLRMSGKDLDDMIMRRSRILSLRKSIRKSMQAAGHLGEKTCLKRVTGQIIAELTRGSFKRVSAVDCQVLESRCWNAEVHTAEQPQCQDMDNRFSIKRKWRPMRRVSRIPSVAATSANSVLITDCTVSVGGPRLPGRVSVCSKQPKISARCMQPPGFQCGSECAASQASVQQVSKVKIRRPVYRVPGLRRPKKGGLRVKKKQSD